MDTTHQTLEAKVGAAQHQEHAPVVQSAFNRRHSVGSVDENGNEKQRRGSIDSMKKSFAATNIAMTTPDLTHLEMSDDAAPENSIDDIAVSWFVWLVSATASIAGSLFGYDTGQYSVKTSLRYGFPELTVPQVSSLPSSSISELPSTAAKSAQKKRN